MRIYSFQGNNAIPSECGISIFGNTVVCTEISSNKGTSVTNAAEKIASEICENFRINPSMLTWIERYKRGDQETFDLCNFNLIGNTFSDPRWQRIAVEDLPTYGVDYNKI